MRNVKLSRTRTQNTIRNFSSGLIKQILNIILPFIIRTIVIYYLGAEYQGLSGLFTSILQMLSLAELGFSTAVVFALYKPISEKNTDLICALVNYLNKVYKIVGIVVLGVGLALLPFLGQLITGYVPENINIYILYLIYLFNTVISYWLFAYKSALLTAMQREDIVSNIQTVTTVSIRVIQIIFLMLFKNYYVYILVMPIGTIANNIFLQIYSHKLFPKIIPNGKVPNSIRENLNKQIKALLISKIADTARNSLDNIIISSFIGLSAVAVYDNYLYIYSGIRGFFLVLVSAMQASVGNSLVEESVDKNYKDLNKFTFFIMFFTGWCTVCLFCLYQPFMQIWMSGNEKMLLSFSGMSLFCIYFYIINMNNTVNLYLHGNGFYWQCRWWYILEAVMNLCLNILLGYIWKINGILIATIITLFAFNFMPRTAVIFRDYFKRDKKEFLLNHFVYFIVTVAIAVITAMFISLIPTGGLIKFVIKSIAVAFISAILFIIAYRKNQYFAGLTSILKHKFKL